MGAMASQITSLTIVCSVVYSDADQRKHQRSASLAFVRGIHRWPHKGPVKQKKVPFDDVITVQFEYETTIWETIPYYRTIVKLHQWIFPRAPLHYSGVIMSAMASQITGVLSVCTTVCSGADQRKHLMTSSWIFNGTSRNIHGSLRGMFPVLRIRWLATKTRLRNDDKTNIHANMVAWEAYLEMQKRGDSMLRNLS